MRQISVILGFLILLSPFVAANAQLPSSDESESPSLMIKISDVEFTDIQGNIVSDLFVQTPVIIQSNLLQKVNPENEITLQSYVYYVQIKELGSNGGVEFIGKFNGNFSESGINTVEIPWIPQKNTAYFLQSYVWNEHDIALGPANENIYIFLVKP